MNLIMDGLLMAGTLFAGLYCWVLSGRVRDLKNLDDGLGASIVTLTRQIELARTTLDEARAGAKENRSELEKLIGQAENSSGRLKMLLSAGRDSIERQRLAAQEHRTVMEAADLALVAARSLHPAPQERSSHRETLAPRPAPRDARPTPEPGSYAAGRGDEDSAGRARRPARAHGHCPAGAAQAPHCAEALRGPRPLPIGCADRGPPHGPRPRGRRGRACTRSRRDDARSSKGSS